ncbi:Uncharacterised protein [Klebsiella variicola]|nr:Uncharacterised protein [Klebsiella variicola]
MFWLGHLDAGRQQGGVANHYSLAYVQRRQHLHQPLQAFWQELLDHRLVGLVGQAQADDVAALAENGRADIRGALTDHHQPNSVLAALFGDALVVFQGALFQRASGGGAAWQVEMRLIANDDNRVARIAVFARAAPELDLVDQPPDQAHNHWQDVRGHLGKVDDFDARIDAIVDVACTEQFLGEIV